MLHYVDQLVANFWFCAGSAQHFFWKQDCIKNQVENWLKLLCIFSLGVHLDIVPPLFKKSVSLLMWQWNPIQCKDSLPKICFVITILVFSGEIHCSMAFTLQPDKSNLPSQMLFACYFLLWQRHKTKILAIGSFTPKLSVLAFNNTYWCNPSL